MANDIIPTAQEHSPSLWDVDLKGWFKTRFIFRNYRGNVILPYYFGSIVVIAPLAWIDPNFRIPVVVFFMGSFVLMVTLTVVIRDFGKSEEIQEIELRQGHQGNKDVGLMETEPLGIIEGDLYTLEENKPKSLQKGANIQKKNQERKVQKI